MTEEAEKQRKFEREMDLLAEDGISCTVEGDKVTCIGDVIKTEKVEVPKETFSAEEVRKRFAEKETP